MFPFPRNMTRQEFQPKKMNSSLSVRIRIKIGQMTPFLLKRPAILLLAMLSAANLRAQNITWTGPVGITGDANLATNGIYFDALMPNSSVATLAVDGMTFNTAASLGGNQFGDGRISYTGSGINNYSWANSFPTSAAASSSFATLMDDGGIYQSGGSGSGTVTISGLTPGAGYEAQIFNYAPDGDAGLTTFSGTTPVTLSNLPGSGGANTYGEFATGSFTASGASETFSWNGGGSGYTVMGPILVRQTSGTNTPVQQPAAWGNATGITGDANLSTNGTYFDALMPNSSVATLTVDGVTFNTAASLGGNLFGDGKISYAASGINNFSWPNSFPTSAAASSSFATLMDDGGIFQNGGAGAGTVTIAGLAIGHGYLVQVFNYAPDGDPGLTTLSGTSQERSDAEQSRSNEWVGGCDPAVASPACSMNVSFSDPICRSAS